MADSYIFFSAFFGIFYRASTPFLSFTTTFTFLLTLFALHFEKKKMCSELVWFPRKAHLHDLNAAEQFYIEIRNRFETLANNEDDWLQLIEEGML